MEKFGVPPDKVVDVQALCGDSVDNVPGAPGIGVKTAAALITEYGDLDTLLARACEIKQPKRRETLIEFADQIRLSRQLVRLNARRRYRRAGRRPRVFEPDPEALLGFLRLMEFRTLTRRIAEALGAEVPAPLERSVGSTVPRQSGTPAVGESRSQWQAGPRRPVLRRSSRRRRRKSPSIAPSTRPSPRLSASRPGSRSARCGPRGLRHRDDIDRSDAGRTRRLLAGGCAGRGLLTCRSPTAAPRPSSISAAKRYRRCRCAKRSIG